MPLHITSRTGILDHIVIAARRASAPPRWSLEGHAPTRTSHFVLPGGSLLFRASATSVAAAVLDSSLFLHLTEQFSHMHGYRPSASEARSWERSIPALVNALNEAGLGDVEVLIEYALPLNSKRADVVLAGVHPTTGEPSYVVVELKQWSQAEPDEDDPALCRIGAYAYAVLNPIEQVRRYCEYLVNFNGALAPHPGRISGVAYLHNATEFGASGLRAIETDDRGRLFTAQQRGAFLDHLRTKLRDKHAGAVAADELLAGKPVPSKQLIAVAADEVRHREQFVLLDEQQVAYRMVLNAVDKAKRSHPRDVSQPLYSGRPPHRPAADRGAHRRRTRPRLPSRRTPSGAAGGDGHGGRDQGGRREERLRVPCHTARQPVPLRRQ